jgi:DNA-binding MarR family transcriptional regulator
MALSHNPSNGTIDTANQLHHSVLHLFRVMRTVRSGSGLTLSKLSILGRLYRDGMATATALATYMRIQPQSLTRVIADLEQQKLIKRQPNGIDRRESLLEITKTGTQLLVKDIQDQREELARTIAKELTPAEQELLRIAAGLMDRLAETTDAKATLFKKRNRNNR